MPILFGNIQLGQRRIFTGEGEPFARTPPLVGFVLCGLLIRVGPRLGGLTPVFGELLPGGTCGCEVQGAPVGGDGEDERLVRVRPGCVAVGLQLRIGERLEAVRLIEAAWRDGALGRPRPTAWVGHDGGVVQPPLVADGGRLMVGIAGRAGSYIDALTPILAEPFRAAVNDQQPDRRSLG